MRLVWGFVLGLLLASCGTSKRDPASGLDDGMKHDVAAMRDEARSWAEVRHEGSVDVRIKGGSDGDATLFNGLLCAAGDTVACDVVKASQGTDGRVWRSPDRVGHEEVDSFSRDMMLGGLLYAGATKDVGFMNRWASYVKSGGKLCDQDTDFRCRFTAIAVGMWNYVAGKIGADKLPLTIVAIPFALGALPPAIDLELDALEGTTPSGFPLHLLGVQVFIKGRLGDWNGTLQNIAVKMARREPKNAFFLYLKNGVDDSVAGLLLALAPKEKPAATNQWAWERTDAEQAWLSSSGWDMDFLASLLLQ